MEGPMNEADVDDVVLRLVAAGAIEECEDHGYLVDNFDASAVEEVREELEAEVGKDKAETLIERAMAVAGMECPGCEKNAAE
jgi:hypothetical protein